MAKVSERRINLRFDPETWSRLDRKRVEERANFQKLGDGFFRAWLAGQAKPSSPFGNVTKDEEELLLNALNYLRNPPGAPLLRAALLQAGRDAAPKRGAKRS